MPNLKEKISSARVSRPGQPGAPLPPSKQPVPRTVPGEGEWERITPETRARVWKKRFGFRSTGTCVCCHQRTIHRADFMCGRRRASPGGGSDVTNLEPVCEQCYEKAGTHDLVLWCKKFQQELALVKPMPKTPAKKTVRKTTAKKTTAKKPVRKAAAKKSAPRKAKK